MISSIFGPNNPETLLEQDLHSGFEITIAVSSGGGNKEIQKITAAF